MKILDSLDKSNKSIQKDDIDLPSFPGDLTSILGRGDLLQVEGTNVIRVPFGIRQARKQKPERPHNWATLVLPLQPSGTPTPPPHAA